MHTNPLNLPPKLLAKIHAAGFASAMELLLHFPLRHEDWENVSPISQLVNGTTTMVEGEIIENKIIPARARQHLLITLEDKDGDIMHLRFFRVTPGLKNMLSHKRHICARGKVSFTPRNGWEMAHPKISINAEKTSRSVYPAFNNLTSAQCQKLVALTLEHADLSPLIPPQAATFAGDDWTLKQSLREAHAPAADGANPLAPDNIAWARLRFEELVAHQIVLRRRYYYRKANAPVLTPPPAWQAQFSAALSFTLTGAQQRAVDDIISDIGTPYPMRRLLQGDVGSGKTAVAAAACAVAVACNTTAAIMAPTEILAEQHYQSLSPLFAKLHIHCELFTGSMTGKQRQEAQNRLNFGLSSLAIGTHALFQENTTLPRLGLVIIDEQHRFGVEQRKTLVEKGDGVHQLMMSATPIPRTLALSLYADMSVSVLDEKPAGRQPVRTIVNDNSKRVDIMARVAKHIGNGGRVYWVCPLVEESDKSDLGDVQSLADEITHRHPSIKVGIIHGRMKSAEKNAVMEKFRAGDYHLLAATTVIEVGVDVAQADVMVIERADRMGLSQLHQLRGRVGRGALPGTCLLLYQAPLQDKARARLQAMRDTCDGFEIARRDLQLRGPGEWLGSRQSGLPSLRVARLGEDEDITTAARQAAEWMLKNDKRSCIQHINRWLGKIK